MAPFQKEMQDTKSTFKVHSDKIKKKKTEKHEYPTTPLPFLKIGVKIKVLQRVSIIFL